MKYNFQERIFYACFLAALIGMYSYTIKTFLSCSDTAGWSDKITFKTPPAGGSDEIKFAAFGDMGKAPRDASVEHYIQVN